MKVVVCLRRAYKELGRRREYLSRCLSALWLEAASISNHINTYDMQARKRSAVEALSPAIRSSRPLSPIRTRHGRLGARETSPFCAGAGHR